MPKPKPCSRKIVSALPKFSRNTHSKFSTEKRKSMPVYGWMLISKDRMSTISDIWVQLVEEYQGDVVRVVRKK